MSPRSRRPSADVQAAREAASVDQLRDRIDRKRRLVRSALINFGLSGLPQTSKGLLGVEARLRESLVQVEILIEQTAKLEKAERVNL